MANRWHQVLLLCSAMMALLFGCGGGDAKSIAGALADKLTDALAIDGGSKQDGAPPSSSPLATAPKIDAATGSELRLGAAFSFSLTSTYAESDPVAGAIVHVIGGKNYISVGGTLSGGTFLLSGLLGTDEELRGKDFALEFALVTKAGLVGRYSKLQVSVVNLAPQTSGATIGALSADGESSFPSGRPAGSSASDAPQISKIDGPSELLAGGAFSLSLSTDFAGAGRKTAQSIGAVILSAPGSAAYKEIPASASAGVVTVSGALSADLRPGDCLVFMLALKAGELVGDYRAWTLTVGGEIEDGDSDAVSEVKGSCLMNAQQDDQACIDYDFTSYTSEDQLKKSCLENEGQWSEDACPRANAVGGCRYGNAPFSYTTWYYHMNENSTMTAELVKQSCASGSATYVEP